MNMIQEFSLLFAVATPVVVLLGMNLFLLLEGEQGTLLMPSMPTDFAASAQADAPAISSDRTPANEPHYPDYRKAA